MSAYDLPQSVGQKTSGGSSWLVFVVFAVVASAIATQMAAAALRFNPELGHPFAHLPIIGFAYPIWNWATWAWQFSPFSGVQYSPAVTAAARAAIVNGLKVGAIIAFPVSVLAVFLTGRRSGGRRLRNVKPAPGRLVIELGLATGALWDMGAKSGIRAGQRVRLAGNDPYQHVLALGGSGSGKSAACLAPIMRQLFEQICGALILNVNGVEDAVVLAIAKKAGRKVRVIGIGGERINLLAGLTPELVATYLSSCMLLGDSSRDSKFWNTTATNLARAALRLLCFFPEFYSLPCLFRFLFIEEFRNTVMTRIAYHMRSLNKTLKTEADPAKIAALTNDLRTIDTSLREISVHSQLDERIRQSVEIQLTSVLSNTIAPELEDVFSAPIDTASVFDLASTYKEQAIFVVNAGIQSYGLASAVILCFIKCRFFDVMQARPAKENTPVAFICDEFQDVASCSQDGRGDHNFFAKARRTRTTCILATQSLHSLVAKVNSDMARAIIANMRTRIAFRNEDDLTIETMLKLLGKTNRLRESSSKSRQVSGTSTSTSQQTSREAIADAELFRNLNEFEAVILASIGNRSADDVMRCTPEFIAA